MSERAQLDSRFPRRASCRLTDAPLESILDLGDQALTGVFPSNPVEDVCVTPLELAWCRKSGLVQLAHEYPGEMMYGQTYGYRSGLNASMVRHLETKVKKLETELVELSDGDIVLDIGANDATTLKAYQSSGIRRVGIDPSAEKFRRFYTDDIQLEVDFFSEEAYRRVADKPAKMITSIAMFYDLPDPAAFVRDIASVLDQDGIWHFEQSYLPLMIRQLAYDTVCQEHLEYYTLQVVNNLLDAAGLKIVDVELNDVNGGSFAVTAAHQSNTKIAVNSEAIDRLLQEEEKEGYAEGRPYKQFAEDVKAHAELLVCKLRSLKASGKRILGLGASTKGNVVLQYAGIGPDLLDAISDVNPDKWGCVTPGTRIPILPESVARAMRPDYFLVLPWHFRDNIVQREAEFLSAGGKLIFPLPNVEVVSDGSVQSLVDEISKAC
ncbi:MAG: methyltransferase [Ponticaulis sp.]|nr:methyltransferase [Ponticaulis sp.]